VFSLRDVVRYSSFSFSMTILAAAVSTRAEKDVCGLSLSAPFKILLEASVVKPDVD